MARTAIRRVEYRCAVCEELDHLRLYEGELSPPAVNCWKCHAGFGLDPASMIQRKKAMFATGNVETYEPALG